MGPPKLPPNWFCLYEGFVGAKKFLASSFSLRRNSNSEPWNSLVPLLVTKLITPPAVRPMPLACQKVRIGGACVSSSHDPNRRDHAVRRYRNVVGLRHVGDLLGFGKPSDLLKVGLDDVDGLLLKQFPV